MEYVFLGIFNNKAMGLDIFLSTNKDSEVYSKEFHQNEKNFRLKMSLSRDFCNLMCRQNVSTGTPEFDQIAALVNVDISPIYAMESVIDYEHLQFQLDFAETEEEKQSIRDFVQNEKNKLTGNIELVLQTITQLLNDLTTVSDLHKKIVVHGDDTIGIDYYFSDFESDKGEGYIGNNFGQDLRNFKRFIEYAKSKGATTIYFQYG